MKVLTVSHGEDFDAMMFEQQYTIDLNLWNRVVSGEKISVTCGDETYDINVTPYEFGAVDPAFVAMVRDFIDYDSSKSSDFFLIQE